MEARDGFGKMTMFRKRSAMWSMDKGTRWKFTSQKRCSEPLPYGHGSERLWISTFMSHTGSKERNSVLRGLPVSLAASPAVASRAEALFAPGIAPHMVAVALPESRPVRGSQFNAGQPLGTFPCVEPG